MPSFVFDPRSGELVPKEQYYSAKWADAAKNMSDLPMPYVRSDLPAYESPIDGRIIEGRAARREDLARSGCREVDPSEYKPIYRNYEFCQKKRLPYMGADVPPPMTKDERVASTERRKAEKAAEKAADAVRAKRAENKIDPDLAKFQRGNTKAAPIFKNNTVKEV